MLRHENPVSEETSPIGDTMLTIHALELRADELALQRERLVHRFADGELSRDSLEYELDALDQFQAINDFEKKKLQRLLRREFHQSLGRRLIGHLHTSHHE